MTLILILLVQIGVLFLLSVQLQRKLGSLLLRFMGQRSAMWLMALLFLPGTFIHELSHWLVAKLLLVPTGKFIIWPHPAGERIIMGSVMIGSADRVRRVLVGLAPGFVGLAAILIMLAVAGEHGYWASWVGKIIVGFLVFEIGNSMLYSKEDVEGVFGLLIVVILILGLLYLLGLRISIAEIGSWLGQYDSWLAQAVSLLWVPVGIDVVAVMGLLVLL